MSSRNLRRSAVVLAAGLFAAAAPIWVPAVLAQDSGGSGFRVDRLEKQMRELRAIVFQGRDTGQPVEVRPTGPDPAVTALEQRFDAMDGTVRQINGQLEELAHNADQAKQANAALNDQIGQLQSQVKALSDRDARLENQLAPGGGIPQGGVAPPSIAPPSIAPAPTGDGAVPPPPTDPTAAAQAADNGRLGDPAAPPVAAPRPISPADSYRAARALVTSGDYAGASNAFQDYVSKHPTAKNLPEAYYWLGESDYAREDYQDATPAYARALKGWPKTAWAGDATVKLSRALIETRRSAEACAALSEFDHRYRANANGATKARAEGVRTRAACAG